MRNEQALTWGDPVTLPAFVIFTPTCTTSQLKREGLKKGEKVKVEKSDRETVSCSRRSLGGRLLMAVLDIFAKVGDCKLVIRSVPLGTSSPNGRVV
jgi:hypothetical protein